MSKLRVLGGHCRKSANQKQLHLARLNLHLPGAWLAVLLMTSPAAANDLEYTAGPSIASSLPANGDPAGIRKSLADRGVTYNLTYINDVLANVRGGARRGVIDQGRLDGALTLDLEKLAGLNGLSVY